MWLLKIFLCSWLSSSLTIFVQEILAYPPPFFTWLSQLKGKAVGQGWYLNDVQTPQALLGSMCFPFCIQNLGSCPVLFPLRTWFHETAFQSEIITSPCFPPSQPLTCPSLWGAPAITLVSSCREIWLGIMQVAAKLNSPNIWLHQVVDSPCWFIVMLTGIWLWCVLNFKTLCGCV